MYVRKDLQSDEGRKVQKREEKCKTKSEKNQKEEKKCIKM